VLPKGVGIEFRYGDEMPANPDGSVLDNIDSAKVCTDCRDQPWNTDWIAKIRGKGHCLDALSSQLLGKLLESVFPTGDQGDSETFTPKAAGDGNTAARACSKYCNDFRHSLLLLRQPAHRQRNSMGPHPTRYGRTAELTRVFIA
jgi:hypothetical protein